MMPTPRRPSSAVAALLCGLVLVTLTAPLAAATRKAPPPDPDDPSLTGAARVEALLERVKHEQQQVKSLEAGFVQRRESSMLLEPDVSSGTFSYRAPSSVRWEYSAPKAISVVIDGEEMTTWYHDLDRAERLKVGRYSDQVLKYLGASGSFDALMEYFQVTVRFPQDPDQPYEVELSPRYERVAKRMAGMTVWVDRHRYLPIGLRYETADGDVTEYQFEDLKVNDGVPSDRFHIDLPPGVEVREVSLNRS
jgi:outer membrane lipoprotein-sorting protein